MGQSVARRSRFIDKSIYQRATSIVPTARSVVPVRDINLYRNKIIHGNVFEVMPELPDNSVDLIVFSPPYYKQRDYDHPDQIGLELTHDLYVDNMIKVLAEAKRIIKPTGAIYMNINDTRNNWMRQYGKKPIKSMQVGSLIGIPERILIRAVDELGLSYQNLLIWYKHSIAPEGKPRRWIVDFEPVYFFTKSPDYFWQQQHELLEGKKLQEVFDALSRPFNRHLLRKIRNSKGGLYGRLKRTVLEPKRYNFEGNHFAPYPPDLIRPLIEASCPKKICKKCGHLVYTEYERIAIDRTDGRRKRKVKAIKMQRNNSDFVDKSQILVWTNPKEVVCRCNAGFKRPIILDPFIGSGTTRLVGEKYGDVIGIDINKDFVKMARERKWQLMAMPRLKRVLA